MRKKIVAGNWKMNKTYTEALQLAIDIEKLLLDNSEDDVTKIISPPFVYISELTKLTKKLHVGAQNCSSENFGAHTGEISAAMIKSVGAAYVIIGHSERRANYGETNTLLVKKVDQVLQNKLIPIFCVGETLAERNTGVYFEVVSKQLLEGLFHLSAEEISNIILAYEPVWAIGTGLTATSVQAQEMHEYIRKVIVDKFGTAIANSISILYGGSCNAQNAKELFACKDVDGGLIGGASLKADDFVKIIRSF